MEDFQKIYSEKLTTPEGAAKLIESNSCIAADIALSQPFTLYKAIAERVRKGELKNLTQHSLLDTEAAPFMTDAELAENYRGITWFSQAFARKAVNAGIMDVMPAYYRDIPHLLGDVVSPDVYVGVVSPMDKHGYFTTGTSHSVSAGILKSAKKVILEVNPNMPRSLSSKLIHISEVDALYENDAPLPTVPAPHIDETSKKISDYIVGEIPNGATLQLGIGSIPDAVALGLKGHKHLGIHTEMFTNSMIDLIKCGAVYNSMKPIHTGKTVATFALGSREMYDYIDDNPAMEILPVNYVNDPAVICQHPNFISINAALEVDFYGQVCAEGLGTKHISGTGGQADFVRGAIQSEGGKSFIAFSSTAAHGTVSRITPTLTPGSPVSTSKNDVDMIVTEYGIAKLRGRSLSQRTKALIAIADPKFRDELTFQAKKENIII